MCLSLAALACALGSAWAQTPEILKVTPIASETPVYGRFTLDIELKATYANPFDPDEVRVDATVTPPSQQSFVVPGFYWGAAEQTQGSTPATPKGGWRVRFAPLELGPHRVVVVVRDKAGEAKSTEVTLVATQGAGSGFVRASEMDPRFLSHEDGSSFYGIGVNLAPQPTQGVDLGPVLARIAEARGNLIRVPLSPETAALALETKVSGGVGRIDQGNAAKLETLLEIADSHGMKAILTIEAYNVLRDRNEDPYWEKTPHNRDHGGPLDTSAQFWTSPEMQRLFRNKLRYLVARYGAYTSLLAWDLWHQVDRVRGYDAEKVRQWHEDTAGFLQGIDPYKHIVTTSVSEPIGERTIDRMDSIGLVQTHIAQTNDLAAALALQHARKMGYVKPHLATHISASLADPTALDPNGMQAHDAIWTSIATGAAGTALVPAWDGYMLSPTRLRLLTSASKFAAGIDWASQRFRHSPPTFEFQQPPAKPARQDLVIAGGPVSDRADRYNLPRRVRLGPDGVLHGTPVAGVLHGKTKGGLRNPVTFDADLPAPTWFDVEVGQVSGEGGAKLMVTLDGKSVLTRDFKDPDPRSPRVLDQYRGSYGFQVPAGRHTIVVSNEGLDWMRVGYRFRDLLTRKTPPLVGWGIAGDQMAIVWVRHADRTHQRVIEMKRGVQPAPPSVLALKGLTAGAWRAEIWDTWGGVILNAIPIQIGVSGTANVPLPAIERDLAVKLVRARPSRS